MLYQKRLSSDDNSKRHHPFLLSWKPGCVRCGRRNSPPASASHATDCQEGISNSLLTDSAKLCTISISTRKAHMRQEHSFTRRASCMSSSWCSVLCAALFLFNFYLPWAPSFLGLTPPSNSGRMIADVSKARWHIYCQLYTALSAAAH